MSFFFFENTFFFLSLEVIPHLHLCLNYHFMTLNPPRVGLRFGIGITIFKIEGKIHLPFKLDFFFFLIASNVLKSGNSRLEVLKFQPLANLSIS